MASYYAGHFRWHFRSSASRMSDGYPLAYLITFACYGARLHGDEVGSVDLQHNRFGTPLPLPNDNRLAARSLQMHQPPYLLDANRRTVVLAAMVEVSAHRGWTLLAAHVRQNHVHAVVRAGALPEKVMNDWKSYASRALNGPDSMIVSGAAGRGTVARATCGPKP